MAPIALATTWPLSVSIVTFILAAAVIGFAGVRLSGICDRLADRTGLGEAFTGAVLLGAATSLPGITASVTAAWDGYPVLSLSNAIGGITAQTAFLALADFAYRRVNLEHAAASVGNMMSSTLLIILLGMLLMGMVGPDLHVGWFHPISPLLIVVYIFGTQMMLRSRDRPTWIPSPTRETREDEPDEPAGGGRTVHGLWFGFAFTVVLVTGAGWALTRAAESISAHTPISDSVIGALMIAIATSLPELVTSVAAVRRGALTLAVGGIIGGNAFDTLFVAAADFAYLDGSIYAAATQRETGLVAMTIIMTAVLLLGLLRREKKGIANIGFESVLVLVLYFISVAMLILHRGQ